MSILLKDRFPSLFAEIDRDKTKDVDLKKLTYGSKRKIWWKCKKGHSWENSVNCRTNRKVALCPFCCNQRICSDNCLLNNDPLGICKNWNYDKNEMKPTEIAPRSNKKFWWLCPKGHSFLQSIVRRQLGAGCQYCANQLVCKDNCLASNDIKNLTNQWHPIKNGSLTPFDVTPTSSREVWWLCKVCKNEWKNKIYRRFNGNCPFCARKIVGIKNSQAKPFNSLAYLFPELLEEWNYDKNKDIDPNTINKATNRKVWWICHKKHEWEAVVNKRTCQGRGCPKCAVLRCSKMKLIAKPGNSLKEKFPEIAEEWDYEKNKNLKPEDVNKSSSRKVWWKCKNSHCSYRRISSRTRYGSRVTCLQCSKSRSVGELRVEKFLSSLEIEFEKQKVFPDCRDIKVLKFDFCITYYGIEALIEFDGIHHFQPVKAYGGDNSLLDYQRKDKIKNTYCEENSIPLLRISCFQKNRTEELIKNFLCYLCEIVLSEKYLVDN